ncbi:hypothetical protein H9L15_14405 [Sphingomonas daechungensis]|uniref:Glycosyltransferase family 25 protein n=1 Tax=Sphingomonas daechungensis TaxID=1176646 RepID=A0ABX6T1N7_9SPHN|nr:hypothetical protein [Sphingomonas daechungensis]QNP43123.1 hypothetical protein H9L15_14405 [Sphingomonas daechungensis]
MSFFDAFDAVRILNLPHRDDRRREMREELARVGLADDSRVSFFKASVGPDAGRFLNKNVHGCFLSHLALLETAAKAGERVLALEDDCDFNAAARDYVLPDRWDIFYGGYEAQDPSDLADSNIIGAHCMGYSPEAARRLSAYLRSMLEDPDFAPDAKAALEPDFDPAIKPLSTVRSSGFAGQIRISSRSLPRLRSSDPRGPISPAAGSIAWRRA